MKRIAAIAVIGWLFIVGSVWSAQVTNVEVSYQDGCTVARIDIQGPVRFTHQTEVPKDGRPDRVIVDILSATHELGAREFLDLPPCVVTGVRTSQYAVTPEQIVRVVFDLNAAPLYRVESDDRSVTVRFTNKEPQSFATWSTRSVVTQLKSDWPVKLAANTVEKSPTAPTRPASVAGQNQAIEKDRLASLTGETKTDKTATADSKQTPPVVDRSFAARNYSEPFDNSKPAQPATVREAPEKPKPASPPAAVKSEPKPAPAVGQTQPVTRPADKPPAQAAAAKSEKKAEPDKVEKKAVAAKPDAAPKAKSSEPAREKSKPATAQSSDGAQQRSTARFRRQAQSDKIRGTMVAEFPKRLVIKYNSRGDRDPFGALVDETRTNNSPVEARIPNVEGLKLVGILESDGGANRALFEDKSGFSYMLETGDKVRNGYVLRVDSDQVYFQIFEYGWSRTVALTME